MADSNSGHDNPILSLIFENIYVGVGLGVIYVTLILLSVLGMLMVVLVEKFNWRTPVFVKFCGRNETFASLTVLLFFIMQSLTFHLLEKYQIIERYNVFLLDVARFVAAWTVYKFSNH